MKTFFKIFVLALLGALIVGCGESTSTQNNPPVASDYNITMDQDTNISATLQGTDADGDELTYTLLSNPTHGTLSGTIPDLTYTPNAGFSGDDSFTFKISDGTDETGVVTVHIIVTANTTPTATSQSITLDQDTTVSITLVGADADGDSLTYVVVDNPSNGALSGTAPNLTYTPNTSYSGTDSFTFKVNDTMADSAVATVSITVNDTTPNSAPTAISQSLTLNQDSNISITLEGNDNDGDAINYTILSQPSHGVLSGTAPDLVYTPSLGYAGSDIFTFQVDDGDLNSTVASISLRVSYLNTAPSASDFNITLDVGETVSSIDWLVASMASDVDNDTLSASVATDGQYGSCDITDYNLTYTKTAQGTAQDTCTLSITDGSGSLLIEVKIDTLFWSEFDSEYLSLVGIKSNGTLWANGSGVRELKGLDLNTTMIQVSQESGWRTVSAGIFFSLAIKDDGTLWMISTGLAPVVRAETKRDLFVLAQIETDSDWKTAAISDADVVAIKENGTLWKLAPRDARMEQLTEDSDWKSVSTGWGVFAAIKSSGTLWTWGSSRSGQLGYAGANKGLPAQVGSDADWKSVSFGQAHTLALKQNGELWGWGDNRLYQLGFEGLGQTTPIRLGTDSSWSSIGAGGVHSAAIKSDGTLWTWGYNHAGQLGHESGLVAIEPTQAGVGTVWRTVSAGSVHTAIFDQNGLLTIFGGVVEKVEF